MDRLVSEPTTASRARAARRACSLSGAEALRVGRPAPVSAALLLLALLLLAASCATGPSLARTSETSGTFTTTGLAVTIFSVDLPKGALLIARENASDANLENMQVTETTIVPYLGPFDWLLDLIGVRWARVRGTWGYGG